MKRSVVFVGNCQLGALAGLYKRFVADACGDSVHYLASYQESSAAQRQIASEADILLHQVLDFAPKIGDLPTRAEVYLVPHLSGAFLWPHGGRAHPKNGPPPFGDPAGPYDAEIGDSFLNKLIISEVDPDEAVALYSRTDIAVTRRVDRLKELVLERQQSRDNACGYDFASFIEANFRTKRLFRTQNHPDDTLSKVLALSVFEKMGVASEILGRVMAQDSLGIFPPTCAPLHPAVINFFGITFLDPDTRYRYFDEGGYTFTEFSGRYMRYQWNALLEEGYHLTRMGCHDEAIRTLRLAIAESPRSASGRYALANLLHAKGDVASAAEISGEAVNLEPSNDLIRRQWESLRAQADLLRS